MVLDARIKEAALKGLDFQISELDNRISELRAMRASVANDQELPNEIQTEEAAAPVARKQASGARRGRPPGRRFSAEARKKLSEAMKKRWAERRKGAK